MAKSVGDSGDRGPHARGVRIEPVDRQRVAASSTFPLEFTLDGGRTQIEGINVLIDGDYGDGDYDAIVAGLAASLPLAHPALKSRIREIVCPKAPHPTQPHAPASAINTTGQVLLWLADTSPDGLPTTDIRELEHEGAHLMFEGAGPPDESEWELARTRDAEQNEGRMWVDTTWVEAYPLEQQIAEDWAKCVEGLLACDRYDDKVFGSAFPNRTAIVRRELGRTALN
jgi:hypothetical protein